MTIIKHNTINSFDVDFFDSLSETDQMGFDRETTEKVIKVIKKTTVKNLYTRKEVDDMLTQAMNKVLEVSERKTDKALAISEKKTDKLVQEWKEEQKQWKEEQKQWKEEQKQWKDNWLKESQANRRWVISTLIAIGVALASLIHFTH